MDYIHGTFARQVIEHCDTGERLEYDVFIPDNSQESMFVDFDLLTPRAWDADNDSET